ncbi:MAG TPA: hypothetical protein VGE59_04480 [Patescibacteria group bacterium]
MQYLLITFLIFMLLLAIFYVILGLYFLRDCFFGLPYVGTKKEIIDTMLSMAKVKPGEKAIDIGSGDGRLVIALAQAGTEAHGVEINPWLVWYSRWQIARHGLKGKAFIHRKSLWDQDYSDFTLVTVYALPGIMNKLEGKLHKELPPHARIVSNGFTFPTWKEKINNSGTRLYTNT